METNKSTLASGLWVIEKPTVRVTLNNHPPEHLSAVERELNDRPRMVLQDRCPADLFTALLTSSGPSVLRR